MKINALRVVIVISGGVSMIAKTLLNEKKQEKAIEKAVAKYMLNNGKDLSE